MGDDASPAGEVGPGARGFDFLLGSWSVRHRKLARRLVGCRDWITFPGTLHVDTILGGAGDIDRNVLEDPVGRYEATSLRVFDARAGNWSIYWIDGRSPLIANPVVGRFAGRVGTFHGDDEFEGRPIRVRFVYENRAVERARWSQAFSADGGAHWEVNWTMDFARRRDTRA